MNNEFLLEKPLPSSPEAEKVILGAILLDNRLFPEALSFLEADDFYSPLHRRVFKAMSTLFKQGRKLDPILIGEELRKEGQLENIGGVATITNLSFGLPHFSGIAEYAKVVNDKSELRKLIKLANEITSNALAEERTADEIKGQIAPQLILIGEKNQKPKWAKTVWQDVKKRFEQWESDEKIFAVKTGIPELDACLRYGGYYPSDLIFVAARPSVGKSALMLQCGGQAAMNGIPTQAFTLEMSEEDLFLRMMPARSGVKNMSITPTTLRKNSEARRLLYDAGEKISKLPMLFEADTFRLDKLIARAELGVKRWGVKFIMIDYLQMLSATVGNRRRDQELEEISKTLKQFAKQNNVPVLCLAQLNRGSEINDRRPEISDIREAGGSEQDADVILLPYRPDSRRKEIGKQPKGRLVQPEPDDDDESNDSIVKVSLFMGKQRNGRANIEIDTDFDMDYQRFMTSTLWREDSLKKLE